MVPGEKAVALKVMGPDIGRWGVLEQLGTGSAPTEAEVKAAFKTWVIHVHPHKNRIDAAKAIRVFKGLSAGHEARRKTERRAPTVPRANPPYLPFKPAYLRSNFC